MNWSLYKNIMLISTKRSIDLHQLLKYKNFEEERIHDVLLILENLVTREELNIKLILDCLYDVGTANLIERQVQHRALKGSLKIIAKISKPACKEIIWRLVRKKIPQLITNLLYEEVRFK